MKQALRVVRKDGHPYHLALNAITGWQQSEDDRLVYVLMEAPNGLLRQPLLVVGTEVQLDAAFAQAACCLIPEGHPALTGAAALELVP